VCAISSLKSSRSLSHLLMSSCQTLTGYISAMKHAINNRKKLVSLQGLPYMPQNLVYFRPQTTENNWRVFCPPPRKVCAQDERQAHISDTFRINHIRQMAPISTQMSRAWLELMWLRAERAYARLCHASSLK